jgi:hypothetical protein
VGSVFTQIAKQVWQGAKAAKLFVPATLIKVTPGSRTSGNVSGGTNPTEASYACAGFVSDYSAFEMAQQIIEVGDRKIAIYGASIASGATPDTNDKITIGGATYRIRRVQTDPAQAVYIVQTHGPALAA